mgnify:CR=1 FL=1
MIGAPNVGPADCTPSDPGRPLRLRFEVRDSGVGDLFCRVQVETPVSLSSEQKDKLRAFDESLRHDESRHNPRARSWFDGVKKFFDRMGA